MKHESGRSMIEMIMVLALVGMLSIGSIMAYQSGNDKNDANKISELVSTASLQGLTRMKNYSNGQIWDAIGKKNGDYECVNSMSVNVSGQVVITFRATSDCNKIKSMITGQWGTAWHNSTNTYTPPEDDRNGL